MFDTCNLYQENDYMHVSETNNCEIVRSGSIHVKLHTSVAVSYRDWSLQSANTRSLPYTVLKTCHILIWSVTAQLPWACPLDLILLNLLNYSNKSTLILQSACLEYIPFIYFTFQSYLCLFYLSCFSFLYSPV